MSREHEKIQDNVEKILKKLGYDTEQEYTDKFLQGKRIDVVVLTKEKSPFIGIEVHIEGDLDSDIKKLVSHPGLTYRVIITPDRELIETGKGMTDKISWFLVPSENESGFENFVRNLKGAGATTPYFFEERKQLVEIVGASERVEKIKELLASNDLDYDVARRVIYTGIANGGLPSHEYRDTKEYRYLQSLGITAGLEFYWDDMKWGDKLKFSYEGVEVPDVFTSRKMNGEPLAYQNWRDTIREIVKDEISSKLEDLLSVSKGYSDAFNELALIGKEGKYPVPDVNTDEFNDSGFNPPLDFDLKTVPPTETARVLALVSNPFLNDQFWEYGNKLVDIGLSVAYERRQIRVLYKPIAEAIRCNGATGRKREEVDNYLSWWILYQGGVANRNMVRYSNILGVPWEKVENCIDTTFSKGLTSKFIPDVEGLRKLGESIDPFWNIVGAKQISVFNAREFGDLCKKITKRALDKIIE